MREQLNAIQQGVSEVMLDTTNHSSKPFMTLAASLGVHGEFDFILMTSQRNATQQKEQSSRRLRRY